MAISIVRSHKGEMILHVNGQPAPAAKFSGMQVFPEGMAAVFIVPTQHFTMGEADNVVPFARPVPKVEVQPVDLTTR